MADSIALTLFGDSLRSGRDSLPQEPTWDLDVRPYATHDRVAHFVSMFSGRAKERITDRLERGTRYEPMIRARMKAGGLPEDMYYLALVESGFDPNAYSRAAAVGMWQFMSSTARDMGLRVDWWVDERRDPVRSTNAAVRFIKDLRNQFGSLYLAAAAYNGGPGRVARGMARFAEEVQAAESEDAFFVLADKEYLKNETRDYVPQLIAAALIAKEPARYGMELRTMAPFAYDSLYVPASTPIHAIAKAAGSDTRTILELNPQFLRGMTPPREASMVRVPVGASATFDSAFAALPKDARHASIEVTTKKGDTPDRIARAHDVSAAAVRAFNPGVKLLKSGRYPVGRGLIVPTPEVAAAMRNVPDPSIEKFPKKTRSLARKGKSSAKSKVSSKASSKRTSAKATTAKSTHKPAASKSTKKKSPTAKAGSGGPKKSSTKKKR
jgi:membrane-bound lytic murein transglycosylase D